MEYKKADVLKLSWTEFDKYMIKIKKAIQKYIAENNLKIDLIVPILRGGGIPALKLAFELRVLRLLPYQYKYIFDGKKSILRQMLKSNLSQLNNFKIKNPTILVVEGNHSTGHLANRTISDLKLQMPKSKIIYVALAKDYSYKDTVKDVAFTTCGFFTNENRKLSKEECKKLKIEFKKVYLFPWESYEEELSALNSQSVFLYN